MNAVKLDPKKLLGFRLAVSTGDASTDGALDLRAAAAKVGAKGGGTVGAKTNPLRA